MSATRRKSRFVGNTTVLAVATVMAAALTLGQVKILSGFLAPGIFGLFAALRGLSLFLAMLGSNGLPHLLVRFLPEFEARAELRRAVTITIWTLGAAVIVLSATCLFVANFNAWLFRSVPSAEQTSALQFWFLATTVGVALKLVLYGGLNGLRRLGAQTVIEVASLIAQVGWMYLVRERLTLELLFEILGTVSLGTVVVALPWYLIRLVRDVRGPDPGEGGAEARVSSGYGSYWIGAAGLGFVALAFTDIDRYILTSVLALETLSMFHVAARVVRMVNRFLAIPVLAFQPEATRLDAEGRGEDVARSMHVFFKFNIALSVFLAVGISAYAGEVIRLVSSAAYLDAVPVLVVLAASLPLTAMTAPLTAVMKARNRIASAFYCDLGWAVTYIALLPVLGLAVGLIGPGLALVAATVVQLALALRLSTVSPGGELLFSVVTRAIGAAALSLLPAAVAGIVIDDGALSIAVRIVCVPVAMLLFRVFIRRFGVFSQEDTARLSSLLSRNGLGRLAARVVL